MSLLNDIKTLMDTAEERERERERERDKRCVWTATNAGIVICVNFCIFFPFFFFRGQKFKMNFVRTWRHHGRFRIAICLSSTVENSRRPLHVSLT